MRLKQLFADDDAVSPVIGVILMVAITVILAAVIASFVLGLGNSSGDVQPNTSFEFDYTEVSGSADTVDMTLTDGDSIELGDLYVRGSSLTAGDDLALDTGSNIASTSGGLPSPGSISSTTEWSPGQTITIEVADGTYEFDLVWETSEDAATLESDEGPDA